MKFRRNCEFVFDQDREYLEFRSAETPYIKRLDPENEFLTIYNPQTTEFSLHDFFISDEKLKHVFRFPEDTVVPPCDELYVYTCPAGNHHPSIFQSPNVLWRNHDGSLRKKEVLNDESCHMELHAPNGECLATCYKEKNCRPRVRRRKDEVNIIPSLRMSFHYQVWIGGIFRLFCLFGAVGCGLLKNFSCFVLLYWISVLLDLTARSPRDKITAVDENEILLTRINVFLDRVAYAVLYASVFTLSMENGFFGFYTGILFGFLPLFDLLVYFHHIIGFDTSSPDFFSYLETITKSVVFYCDSFRHSSIYEFIEDLSKMRILSNQDTEDEFNDDVLEDDELGNENTILRKITKLFSKIGESLVYLRNSLGFYIFGVFKVIPLMIIQNILLCVQEFSGFFVSLVGLAHDVFLLHLMNCILKHSAVTIDSNIGCFFWIIPYVKTETFDHPIVSFWYFFAITLSFVGFSLKQIQTIGLFFANLRRKAVYSGANVEFD